MTTLYFYPVKGGRWTTSKTIAGKRVYLVQNSPLDCTGDINRIFGVLGIEHTPENIQHFLPNRGVDAYCPTLELLELFGAIGREAIDTNKKEVGV